MGFEEYLEELADASRQIRASRLTRLSHLTGEQREVFSHSWPGIDAKRRQQVVGQLADLAKDNVDLNFDAVFFICLEDEDASVRLAAIRGLWEYEGCDLIVPLLRLLEEDEEVGVRAGAALALGRFVLLSEYGTLRERHFQRLESVLRRILDDSSQADEVRARALEAVGACSGRPWVRHAIHQAYESGARRLKVSAIHAMGRSCDSRWLPLLLRDLASEDAEARFEAAVACGSIGDEAATPHLAPLLHDDDPEVRSAAIAALGEIGGADAKGLLLSLADSDSPDVREAARDALSGTDFGQDPLTFPFRP